VILGATSSAQLLENLGALAMVDKLTDEVLEKIEAIVASKPKALSSQEATAAAMRGVGKILGTQ
jgi:hypothetical protein